MSHKKRKSLNLRGWVCTLPLIFLLVMVLHCLFFRLVIFIVYFFVLLYLFLILKILELTRVQNFKIWNPTGNICSMGEIGKRTLKETWNKEDLCFICNYKAHVAYLQIYLIWLTMWLYISLGLIRITILCNKNENIIQIS